ncbi:peptidylprolyl isomerase [bacterium]|nr:peptidylprolyl isomerase [bacterium]
MTKFFYLSFTCLLALSLTVLNISCSGRGGAVSDDEIAVTWDDTLMTVADFKDKMLVRFSTESSARKKTLDERFSILDEYVMRAIKIAEGYRLGFHEREDIRKSWDDAVERAASEKLYDSKVIDSFVTDKMLKDFFEKNQIEVRCRHILITMSDDVKGKDTLKYWNRINEAWEKAKKGEDFKRLVREYSEDKSIANQDYGDLGFFKWGKMVDEFQDAAWALKPGEISKPVRTRYGYHLIQMIETRPTGLEFNTSHILVKVTKRAAPAETTVAWERANMILEEAKKKGADFEKLARRYSEDNKTWVNGIVGWIPRGSMPSEYWDYALNMKKGEIGGPARTYKGYHIIKVNDIRVAESSLDDKETEKKIKSSIARVYRDTVNTISENYLANVKKQFNMKYDSNVVKKVLKKLSNKNVPENVNMFSTFTPEERELLIVTDDLGGLKVQALVDQYGDHRFPIEYDDTDGWLESLIEPILLPKYLSTIAKQEGYYDDPDVLADAKKAIENAILPEVEKELIFNKATPSEKEVEEYFNSHKEEFVEAATARVYEILVDDKQLADDMRARIDKGEKISTLARRYSQRKDAQRKGGKLGPFTVEKYGPVSQAAFELEIGQVAGPIKVGNMYSVIELIEKNPVVEKTLDEVRRQIESNMRFERQKDLKEAWENELRKEYNVQVNEDIIERVWPIIDQLPEELEAERKGWQKERAEEAKKAARKAQEDQIKVKLRPGTEQEYTTKDGKQVKLKIGEPRYIDKDGNEIPSSEANVKLTPKGRIEKKDADNKAPKISITPKTKSSGK